MEIRNCTICAKPYTATGHQQLYCTRACSDEKWIPINTASRRAKQHGEETHFPARECVICSVSFREKIETGKGHRITCSAVCAKARQTLTTLRSHAAKKAQKQAVKMETIKLRVHAPPIERNCVICNTVFFRQGVVGGNRKTCSGACSTILRRNSRDRWRGINRTNLSYPIPCIMCGVFFFRKTKVIRLCSRECRVAYRSRKGFDERQAARSILKVCVVCNVAFSEKRGIVCSLACRSARKKESSLQYYKATYKGSPKRTADEQKAKSKKEQLRIRKQAIFALAASQLGLAPPIRRKIDASRIYTAVSSLLHTENKNE